MVAILALASAQEQYSGAGPSNAFAGQRTESWGDEAHASAAGAAGWHAAAQRQQQQQQAVLMEQGRLAQSHPGWWRWWEGARLFFSRCYHSWHGLSGCPVASCCLACTGLDVR